MRKIELKVNKIDINKDREKGYLYNYLVRTIGITPEHVASFINIPTKVDLDDYTNLNGIKEAAEAAHLALTNPHCKIKVIVDSDADGYTSSTILIRFLKQYYPTIPLNYYLHPGKEHGIVLEAIDPDDTLIFIPDAGSNDYDLQEELVKQGKTVIILDHHEINHDEWRDTGAKIVNNQNSPLFSNKSLSGAGVTLMFIQCYGREYLKLDTTFEEYMDLAAIGIIADAMNMTTLGNNYISFNGLKEIHNKFIKQLTQLQHEALKIKNPNSLTKMDVMWYIAPIINGVIRSGKPEDKKAVFDALITDDGEKMSFVTVWRGKERTENLYEYAARLAMNAKSRQDNNKKKSFEWLVEKITTSGLNKDNLIIVALDEKESSKVGANITGLIANELVKYFNRPCLVLRQTEYNGKEVYGGSGRNGDFCGLPNLLTWLEDSHLIYYAAGHQSAFGVFIEKDKIQALRDYANTVINESMFQEKAYAVDYWFNGEITIKNGCNSAAEQMLDEFAEREDLWGNSIAAPLFAFELDINSLDEINFMGAKKNSIKINTPAADFVKFTDEKLADELKQRLEEGPCHLTLVGSPSINEYKGFKKVQVKIDDCELKSIPGHKQQMQKAAVGLFADLI